MKRIRFTKTRMVLCCVGLLLAGLAGLNWLAWRHARAMTHFSEAGVKTAPPESLSRMHRVSVLLSGVNVPKPRNQKSPADVALTHETLRFRGARNSDLEAWHVKRSDARGIVAIFHGYASSKDSLLSNAVEFHHMGWEVLLVDFHGSGGSSGKTTSIGWDEADDVLAAFAQAKSLAKDRPVVLYGASMGAAAALRAVAVHGIQPSAMILECPFDRMLTTVRNRFDAMGVPAFPSAHLLVFWGGRQFDFNAFSHNPADYAKRVRCPVLQLHGLHDPRVSLVEAKRVFDHLAGSKRWVEFDEAGHESYLASEPGKWRDAVGGFLSSQEAMGKSE